MFHHTHKQAEKKLRKRPHAITSRRHIIYRLQDDGVSYMDDAGDYLVAALVDVILSDDGHPDYSDGEVFTGKDGDSGGAGASAKYEAPETSTPAAEHVAAREPEPESAPAVQVVEAEKSSEPESAPAAEPESAPATESASTSESDNSSTSNDGT